YRLSVRVNDANLTELTSVSLDPVTVVAAPAGQNSQGNGNVSSPKQHIALGAPQIQAFTVGAPGEAPATGQSASVKLSMANPYARPLTNVKATLLLDGNEVQAKTIDRLLPQQSRSVEFANVVFPLPGKHEVEATLESSEAKAQKSSVASQVQVSPPTSRNPAES